MSTTCHLLVIDLISIIVVELPPLHDWNKLCGELVMEPDQSFFAYCIKPSD